MRRYLAWLTVAAAFVVGTGGCGGSTATRPAGPADAPAAIARLHAAVVGLGAVEVGGGTTGSPIVGRRQGISDLNTGDFSATISLGKGLSLEMKRQGDLTWTKAPAVYWAGIGYTSASAQAATGKWVVASVAGIKPMVEAMDPATVVVALRGLRAADVVDVQQVRSGALRGDQVLTFRQEATVERVFLTSGAHPRLRRVTSTKAGATTWVDFLAFPQKYRVQLPRAADVLQAQ